MGGGGGRGHTISILSHVLHMRIPPSLLLLLLLLLLRSKDVRSIIQLWKESRAVRVVFRCANSRRRIVVDAKQKIKKATHLFALMGALNPSLSFLLPITIQPQPNCFAFVSLILLLFIIHERTIVMRVPCRAYSSALYHAPSEC